MGTNYYLRKCNVASPPCPTCGHQPDDDVADELHIGKSSSGWNFGLRIYPKTDDSDADYRLRPFGVEQICELDDWLPLFERFDIFDEYDRKVQADEMIATITERSHPLGLISRVTAGPKHMGSHAGPRADTLAGKGTYDLCNFEFS